MINFDYAKPSTQKAAMEALNRNSSAMFIAGGTNLVDLMKKGVVSPDKLIDITALPLRSIEQKKGLIRIGALTLNSVVAENSLIKQKLPLLSLALQAGASPQIRNMATVGGNLLQRTRCHYFYDTTMPCNKRRPGSGCSALKGYNRMHALFTDSEKCIAVHPSDMSVALTAMGANIVIEGQKGERKISCEQFFRFPGNEPEKDTTLNKGELITAIEIEENKAYENSVHYEKIRDRFSYAFALVSVAAALEIVNGTIINSVRLAVGGVAHKPMRLHAVEKYLAGKTASYDHFNEAAHMSIENAKGYGYNNFKLKLLLEAIKKSFKSIVSNTNNGQNVFYSPHR
jgi:xanthine dehydrogenase YagS FAD-binding subunit